jgi:hypothetical protein
MTVQRYLNEMIFRIFQTKPEIVTRLQLYNARDSAIQKPA